MVLSKYKKSKNTKKYIIIFKFIQEDTLRIYSFFH